MNGSLLGRRLALGLCVAAAAGCDSFLDVNTNPNAPEVVGENLLLPSVVGTFGFGVLGTWPASLGAEWTQQIAYNGERQNVRIEKYEMNETEMDRIWGVSYSQVMNGARTLASQAEQNGNYAYAGIAKVVFAWNLSVVTDMWGPVPYAEAWDPANPDPKYDTQQEVYAAVFETLDEAIADFDRPSTRAPGRDDLLYGGDVSKWRKLAYTLQGRLHLQLSTAPGENTTERAQLALTALQQGFASNADDADFAYFDVANQRNPWYGSRLDNRIRMAKHYVDLLQSLGDPRLAVQAGPAPAVEPAPAYVGHPNGAAAVDSGLISPIGAFYNAGDATLTWISYADAKLTEAEARLLTAGAAAADAPYREGVRAHMEKLGIDPSATAAYVDALPSLASAANPRRDIIVQKYIVNFLNYQAWNDWRRTGYPELTPVPGASMSTIPVRLRPPASELTTNLANLQAAGTPTGADAMAARVWWDPE